VLAAPLLVEELRRVRARDTETILLPRYGDSHCDTTAALALGVSHAQAFAVPPVAVAVRPPRGFTIASVIGRRYSASEFG
jgi:hypothetical protein